MTLNRTATDNGPVRPFESDTELAPQGRIDELVFAALEKKGIRPARTCSDGVFLRRAYLDVIGTLPTEQEARAFLDDKSATKRQSLVARLLAREEFADYWALKWGDLLRVKAEFPINLWPNAAQAYHRWIRTCLHDNVPYDRFVREMLTASGSNFRVPQVNFYRAIPDRQPAAIAQAVALTFMGTRADRWPKGKLAAMTAFFSRIAYKKTDEWKEEIVLFDPTKTAAGAATFPDGTKARIAAGQDPRIAFADWLIAPGNPWFARNIANRIWYWLLGRGIIQEPDDIRPDNPPSNAALLAYLERELVTAKFDLKHLYKLILTSKAYQLSSVSRSDRPEAAALFAQYPLRRLDAEVLIDALNQITATGEAYTSATPEPFTFVPDDRRSITLPDGSITSAFLEMFGRPARDTGLESERNNRPTDAQRLHMLNSSHVLRKIERCPLLVGLPRRGALSDAMTDRLYLTILSRFPTDDERRVARQYAQRDPAGGRTAAVDLAWALINSAEFLYRH